VIQTRDSRAQLAAAAEATVVRLAALGDDAAFAELVRRRQSAIRSLLRRLCGESALSDDLAQQTFMAAWSQLAKLRQPAAFGGWLRQIAVNAWLAHLRREGAVWVPLPRLHAAMAAAGAPAAGWVCLQRREAPPPLA
jgi:RNA polymerase sigma-70 factor (ECF subfamily)